MYLYPDIFKSVDSHEWYSSLYMYLLFTFMPLFISPFGTDSVYAQNLTYSSPAKQGMSSEQLSKVFDPIQRAIDTNRIGGAVGPVARNGKVIFLRSAGKLDENTPMPTNAITRLASITKAITAASVMILRSLLSS